MIVPMKKISVIVQSKDADSAIGRLGRLGVLHIEHQQPPAGGEISRLLDEIALINQAIGILSRAEFTGKTTLRDKKEPDNWRSTASHIIDSYKRFDQLEEYSRVLKNRISKWEAWGDFDPDLMRALSRKNVFIKLYQIPVKKLKNMPAGVIVKKIFTAAGVANCVVISRESLDLPFKEVTLPKIGLGGLRKRLAKDNRVKESIKEEIRKSLSYCESLLHTKKTLEKDLEFQEVLRGMGESGQILYLTGFAPFDRVNPLQELAREEKWGIVVAEPAEEDRVPTLIRNPRWVSMIQPIFKLIEVIPGYRELDVSLLFLLFLSLFFGMLIGDAGYGLVFFALTFVVQRKLGRGFKDRSAFILFYLFSFCAIIWGILSGTFFGQGWLPGWVKPVVPSLREAKELQVICFTLGAIHLSIAHFWRAIIKFPSPRALSELGWISILWGAFFLAKLLILGDAFPLFAKWLFISGVGLVIFFTSFRKNILKGIGAGLGNLLLNLVNSFTDIVSYIRLFAVGLATVAVADSFNKMAMEVGYSSLVTGALTALILFVGHALNILLGAMSIIVHGVRLNVLEFCNHIDVKWSGFAYRPLQEKEIYYEHRGIAAV